MTLKRLLWVTIGLSWAVLCFVSIVRYDMAIERTNTLQAMADNQRRAEKRGGGQPMVTFDEQAIKRETRAEDLLALDEALERLAKLNERQSKIVEYRFFGGLSQPEIAEVLSGPSSSVRQPGQGVRRPASP